MKLEEFGDKPAIGVQGSTLTEKLTRALGAFVVYVMFRANPALGFVGRDSLLGSL